MLIQVGKKNSLYSKSSKRYNWALSTFDHSSIFNNQPGTARKMNNSNKNMKVEEATKEDSLKQKKLSIAKSSKSQMEVLPKINRVFFCDHRRGKLMRKPCSQLSQPCQKKEMFPQKLTSQKKIMQKILKLTHLLGIENTVDQTQDISQVKQQQIRKKERYRIKKGPFLKQRLKTQSSGNYHQRPSFLFSALGSHAIELTRKPFFSEKHFKKQEDHIPSIKQSKFKIRLSKKYENSIVTMKKQRYEKNQLQSQEVETSICGWTRYGRMNQQIDY